MKVTIDLAQAVEHLAYPEGDDGGFRYLVSTLRGWGESTAMKNLASQIEAQLPKPKPEEPTGLGAVVEDNKGELYVGLGDHYGDGRLRWKGGRGMTFTSYDRISAVKVLSEGVHP